MPMSVSVSFWRRASEQTTKLRTSDNETVLAAMYVWYSIKCHTRVRTNPVFGIHAAVLRQTMRTVFVVSADKVRDSCACVLRRFLSVSGEELANRPQSEDPQIASA